MSRVIINIEEAPLETFISLSSGVAGDNDLEINDEDYTINLEATYGKPERVVSYTWERSFEGSPWQVIATTTENTLSDYISQEGTTEYRVIALLDTDANTDYSNVVSVELTYPLTTPEAVISFSDGSSLPPNDAVIRSSFFPRNFSAQNSINYASGNLTYLWEIINEPTDNPDTSMVINTTTNQVECSEMVIGNYEVRLTVTDSNGLSDTATYKFNVLVNNPRLRSFYGRNTCTVSGFPGQDPDTSGVLREEWYIYPLIENVTFQVQFPTDTESGISLVTDTYDSFVAIEGDEYIDTELGNVLAKKLTLEVAYDNLSPSSELTVDYSIVANNFGYGFQDQQITPTNVDRSKLGTACHL